MSKEILSTMAFKMISLNCEPKFPGVICKIIVWEDIKIKCIVMQITTK